jgi:hypothetical protein
MLCLAEIGMHMHILFPAIPLPIIFSGEQNVSKPPVVTARPLEAEAYEDYDLRHDRSRNRLAVSLTSWARYYRQEACALENVSELLAAVRGHRSGRSPSAMLQPDGPSTAGRFYHAGKAFQFPALQWRLLKVLFGRGAVPVEEVLSAVYPDEEDVSDVRLRKLIHDTEEKFEEHGLTGFDIERPMSGHIALRCPS